MGEDQVAKADLRAGGQTNTRIQTLGRVIGDQIFARNLHLGMPGIPPGVLGADSGAQHNLGPGAFATAKGLGQGCPGRQR